MNIIFVGYRKWAYEIEKKLLSKKHSLWTIVATITTKTPEASYKILSPEYFKTNPICLQDTIVKQIKNHKPDIFLFYGWSWMIPKEIYENYPCLVLHISPLPKYRGGSPLQHQIIAGETTSAISIFKAAKGIDAGDIYSQTFFSLEGTLEQIFKRIISIGIEDTIKVLNGLAKKTLLPIPQDKSKATTFKRRKLEDSEITIDDFKTKTAKKLYNIIRSLADPYPNAYFICKDGKKIYFTGAKIDEDYK